MRPLTDKGNAERLFDAYGGILRYNPSIGWFVFAQGRWIQDDLYPLHLAADLLSSISQREVTEETPEDIAEAIRRWERLSQAASKIEAAVRLARSRPELQVRPEELDRNPWLLNCQNGIVNLQTGQLEDQDPERYMTKQVAARYEPEATAPRWMDFLDAITMGSREYRLTLQQAVGYSLTGTMGERCLFVLWGTGANGKSVFLDTLHDVLGSYAQNMPPDSLMWSPKGRPQSDTSHLAMLRGKRFVMTSEGEKGAHFSQSIVKSITGDHNITARFLYKNYFSFTPTFKVWFATNHMPNLVAVDAAIRDRIRRFPFRLYVPREERDPDLIQKLRAEASGILRWAVEGCVLWQACERQIQWSSEVTASSTEYFDEQDKIGQFILDCTASEINARVATRTLYEVYRKWSEKEGFRPGSHRSFSIALKEKGLEQRKIGGSNYWWHIGLTADAEAARYPGRDMWG